MTTATPPRRQSPSPRSPKSRSENSSSTWKKILLPVALILAGLMILGYPVAATLWNNYNQQQLSEKYSENIQQLPVEERERQLAEAEDYNYNYPKGPILDP